MTTMDEHRRITGILDSMGYRGLGWANDWGAEPPLLRSCKAKKHVRRSQKCGGEVFVEGCEACRIYWTVDAGD